MHVASAMEAGNLADTHGLGVIKERSRSWQDAAQDVAREQWAVLSAPFGRKPAAAGLLSTLPKRASVASLLWPAALAYLLSLSVPQEDRAWTFLCALASTLLGQICVTVSASLVGASVGLLQGMALLSYGTVPLLLAGGLCLNVLDAHLRAVVVAPCFVWSVFATAPEIAAASPSQRRALTSAPVWFHFLSLSWMTLIAASGFNELHTA
mmetsp:Transcript_19988/g.38113  ORF Transcript_19988/g.38113 Transcript_19988/m.38113 type:complete len:209 (-) Transcript_19988:516-1142(-)